MICHFVWSGKQLPPEFPTEDQMRRRVTGVKYHHKKKVVLETPPEK